MLCLEHAELISQYFAGQGSVEGLSYESYGQTLYWTCNNEATISRMSLLHLLPQIMMYNPNSTRSSKIELSKVETVVNLEKEDKPRGIVTDSCNSYVSISLIFQKSI